MGMEWEGTEGFIIYFLEEPESESEEEETNELSTGKEVMFGFRIYLVDVLESECKVDEGEELASAATEVCEFKN